jgi:hypothetical protein
VVIALAGAHLTNAWGSPERTITVPITLARTVHLEASSSPSRIQTDFPATHVAFTWRGPRETEIRYRTISESEAVTEWQKVPEVHGPPAAEKIHKHFSAVMAVDGVVAVDWAATGPYRGRVQDVVLDYLNTLDGPRREVIIPEVVDAAANDPHIVTRAEWGADESLKRTSGGCKRRFFRLQQIFVHHTAGENYDQHPKATMRAIYWYHVVRQGWCDVGYNFVIAPDGTLFEGRWARRYRPWERHDSENGGQAVVVGAHVEGYNSGSLGISLMGNYSQVDLPPSARRTLVQLLAWETDRHDLDPQRRHTYRNPESGATKSLHFISGHRDAGSTACPGSRVYGQLPGIRREAAAVQANGKAGSLIELDSAQPSAVFGEEASFEGSLTDAGGNPLSARPVSSYFREAGRRWKRGPDAATDADGRFSFSLAAERNLEVIAIFDGEATYWGDQSDRARVRISPAVTIEAEGGTPDTAGVSHHPSGTEFVDLIGDVTPAHTKREVIVMIGRVAEDGSYEPLAERHASLDDSSAYRVHFLIPDENGGTYRATAFFPRDEDHGSGRSAPITFVVDP